MVPSQSWPEGFTEYFSKLSSVVPDEKWCEKNSILSYAANRKVLIFLGSKVASTFKDAKKAFINGALNIIWERLPWPIPSGFQKYMYVHYC